MVARAEARAFISEADLLVTWWIAQQRCDCMTAYLVGRRTSRWRRDGIARDKCVCLPRAAVSLHRQGLAHYLSLELMPRQNNLFYLMKPSGGRTGAALPTERIDLALQFAAFLQDAHRQQIDIDLARASVKDGATLRIIDFNSSKLLKPAHTLDQSISRIFTICAWVFCRCSPPYRIQRAR